MILSIPFANNFHRKRKYSNEETREVALPWFWENCKFDEFSIWRFDYLYNEELTMTFMSNNQIGGFFARLEGSRKYIFNSLIGLALGVAVFLVFDTWLGVRLPTGWLEGILP